MRYAIGHHPLGAVVESRGRYSITYDGGDALGEVFMVRRDGRPWSRTRSEVLARHELRRLEREEIREGREEVM